MRTVVAALALAFLAALQLVAGLRSPVAAAALQRRGRLLSAAKKPLPPPPAAPEKKGELGFNLQSARRITRWIMFPGIFKDFDSTEERMKPTVVVKPKTLSKREKEYMSVRYSDRGLEPEDKPSLWDKLQGR